MKRAVGDKGLAFLTLCAFAGFILAGPLSYAAPPEGKGNAGGNGNGNGNAGSPPGQAKKAENASAGSSGGGSSSSASGGGSSGGGKSAEVRLERTHPHQDRANLGISGQGSVASDRRADSGTAKVGQAAVHSRGADHGIRGREAAKAHVDSLLKSLNKFEQARWDYNPKDTRGQGNMGKPNMRDPYGFDKDSGREGAERGRAIREPEVLDLAALLALNWQITDWYVAWYQYLIDYYRSMLSSWWWLADWAIPYLEQQIAYRLSLPETWFAVNGPYTLNYTLSFGDIPTSFEGDTVLVTTTLTSLNNFDSQYTTGWFWMDRRGWIPTTMPIHYDAGQVVVSQTQEVTLSDSGTFTYTYDPPYTLVGWNGGYFQLAATVTEPTSGATYTITYDKTLYFFVCPYGIVYDQTTGKPVVGATVAIHNADGSVVALDQGANPNVSNPQKTDATGRYNAKLAVGRKYYLTVKAPGYEEYKSPLFSERWHIVREDVGLTPLKVTTPPSESAAPLVRPEGKRREVHPGAGVGAPLPSK